MLKPVQVLAVALLAAGLLLASPAHATTVVAPDFQTMVAQADFIFTGRVIGQRAEWRNINGQRSIVTLVTFEMVRLHKGQAGRTVQLQFLGGKIGDASLEVDAMPKFREGERLVLFVEKNSSNISPLVGFFHGKFNVLTDDSVSQHDGAPLGSVANIGKRRKERVATRAIAHADFAREIETAVKGK